MERVLSRCLALTLPVLLAGLAGAGCHHEKPPETTGGDLTDTQKLGDKPAARDESGDMIPPEKMEEVTRLLDRKRETVSRCLAVAIDNKELPKNSKGSIRLEIVIRGQKATSVKVISATLESKSLADCVIGKVNEIEFPALEHEYETSYSYTFEAI